MGKMIIFDLGGVIVKRGTSVQKEILKKTGVNIVSAEGKRKLLKRKLREDKIQPEKFFQSLIKDSKVKISVKKFMGIYKQSYTKNVQFDKRVINIIKKLRKKYSVACLSDTNKLHWQIFKEMGLLNIFNRCFASQELGIVKDKTRAFKIVTKKLNINPKNCIFIDDKKVNIKNAKSIGMDAIQFKNYKQFVGELKARGLLS